MIATSEIKYVDFYQVHAIEKAELQKNWKAYKWEAFPKVFREPCLYVEITGSVCDAVVTRGARAGRTNWDKMDISTRRTVILTIAEHNAWKLKWEMENSKCHECQGHGKTMASCGVSGTTYRECFRCKGTGLPQTPK